MHALMVALLTQLVFFRINKKMQTHTLTSGKNLEINFYTYQTFGIFALQKRKNQIDLKKSL
jgi:hypothetical protein